MSIILKIIVICVIFAGLFLSLPRIAILTAPTSQSLKQEKISIIKPPRFILGVSTGHAGSTTAQNTLLRSGCPYPQKGMFEGTIAYYETTWNCTSRNATCQRVKNVLIPHLYKLAPNKTLVDVGHYHNRGFVLECLAEILGDDAAFVRIRRSRYDVAASFSSRYYTPCLLTGHKDHPIASLCPHSLERQTAGPVYLQVEDDIWDDVFTPFQRFLWYADEMEERWHVLTNMARGDETNRPQFLQVTWSSSDELQQGLYAIRSRLGCVDDDALQSSVINKDTQHVVHKPRTRNCSDLIRQDLEYRRLVFNSTDDRYRRLFQEHAQNVASSDCMDTHDQLVAAIRQYSTFHGELDLDSWILPSK